MNTPAWIGLGSNLGDRKATLDAAIAALGEAPGVVVRAVSGYHETRPVGGPPGQGGFLNAAARLDTTLDPHQLLAVMQEIEDDAGRVRAARWGERTLDLDILIFGTKFSDIKELNLPHPRLAFRRFVLAPLAEIAPNIVDTTSRLTIAGLLANLDRRPRLLALDGMDGRLRSTVFHRLVGELPGFGITANDLKSTIGPGGEPFPDPLEILDWTIEALESGRREVEASPVSWIVADFFLGFDFLRPSSAIWWINLSGGDSALRRSAYHRAVASMPESTRRALQPTLVVALPGGTQVPRRPGAARVPVLRPDSEDTDSIVDEVLATCRGIEGV